MSLSKYPDELWERARQDYIESTKTVEQVATELGIAVSTLRRRAGRKRENWAQLRRDHAANVLAHERRHAELSSALNAAAKIESRTISKDVGRLLMRKVVDALRAAGPNISADELSKLSMTAQRAQEIEFKALGIHFATIQATPELAKIVETAMPETAERGDRPGDVDEDDTHSNGGNGADDD